MTRMIMRLITCANTVFISSAAVLLSGCSWMGYGGNKHSYQSQNAHQGGRYSNQAQRHATNNGRRTLGRCQITAPTQRAPQGCRPEQVTLALPGSLGGSNAGYAQQGQYTNGGYGSHVGAAAQARAGYTPEAKVKKSRLRAQFGMEIDHSVSGNLMSAVTTPVYNPATFIETSVTGVIVGGDQTTRTYTVDNENAITPNISFDDVYTAPLRLSAGLEYIVNDHNTIFASAGITRAEGKKGGGTSIVGGLRRTETVETFDLGGVSLGSQVNASTFPNVTVATYAYDFNEMQRLDVELGGRHYFNQILPEQFASPVTPFISASGGAAHHSNVKMNINQRQLFQEQAYESGLTNMAYYDVATGGSVDVYDAQWVPYGAVKAGVEWQMTPKTALAFEAGVKYEGARDYSNGIKGDDNITIPLTIRGSYNF